MDSLNDESKNEYHFGSYEKIRLDPKELEVTVYAIQHTIDLCDPMMGTLCSPQ